MKKTNSSFSRRTLLVRGMQLMGATLLSACANPFDRLHQDRRVLGLLETVEEWNRRTLRFLTGKNSLAQEFTEADISRFFKPNGNPPPLTMEYIVDALNGWPFWRLEVTGAIKTPLLLSLEDLLAMPSRTQITRHDCVEGWSAIAKWKGTPLAEIIKLVEPFAQARYVVFYCMDVDSRGNLYYESIDFDDALHPQTILAYDMNDRPLPVEHGAPLRLRVERQLGYKMAKYVQRIEFATSLNGIGEGKGGYWEDRGYEWYAGI